MQHLLFSGVRTNNGRYSMPLIRSCGRHQPLRHAFPTGSMSRLAFGNDRGGDSNWLEAWSSFGGKRESKFDPRMTKTEDFAFDMAAYRLPR